ncbi:hypothetical protein ACFV80_36045 [Streptomyces sp. NPDC059862]|uniref:hypothetical protein n=1 Tax=Streptomyces sp. NPDC059862 TaxID=3346975 RepID=UPI0036484D2D
MSPGRRRDAERRRTLADARARLVGFLQQWLGPDVDGALAQDLLRRAEAWESPPTVYALAAHVENHPEALKAPAPDSPIGLL